MSEYTSKNDKYGICFPSDSNEEEKCLIVYCTLLIDYLLFSNFWIIVNNQRSGYFIIFILNEIRVEDFG